MSTVKTAIGEIYVISNKKVRAKDHIAINQKQFGFFRWKNKKDLLVKTQRGYFINDRHVSVTSMQNYLTIEKITNFPYPSF